MELSQLLTDVMIVVANSPFLALVIKVCLMVFVGVCVLTGMMALNAFVIEVFVPKDIRPFYGITLFLVTPVLLTLSNPTYWFEPLSLEIPYVHFYFLFYIIFLVGSVLVLYFISLYWKLIRRKPSGIEIVDKYPIIGGTVLAVLCFILVLMINFSFY